MKNNALNLSLQGGIMKKSHGFTLIELMIVVAVIGILSAIAYPSYTEYVLRGRRAEARTALMDLMQQQERFFTQTGAYAAPLTTAFKAFSGDSAANGYYTLQAAACTAPNPTTLNLCVTLTATRKVTGSDPTVGDLTFDSTGFKSCINGTDTTKSKCWK
jgi:type IV pilus assembly protein PilE